MPQLTIKPAMDGARGATVHVNISGDEDGDLSGAILVDPATTFAASVPSLSIDTILYGLIEFNCRLDYETPRGDAASWSIAKGNGAVNFDAYGSLQMNGTGTLRLTTLGLLAGQSGSLIIVLTKKT